MRRSKQEITDKKEIEDIIKNARTARLGLNREGAPYVLPMNFGFKDDIFYFHCAGSGLKLDLLKADANVCIEIDETSPLVKRNPEKPCDWGVDYRSLIATGKAEFLTDFEEKKEALHIILKQFDTGNFPALSDDGIRATTVFRVQPDSITAKKSG